MRLFKKVEAIAFPVLLLGFSLFFLIYEILRAVQVDITYDEATAYLNYLTGDPLNVLNFISTNNHFLNTFWPGFFAFLAGTPNGSSAFPVCWAMSCTWFFPF